MCNQKKLNRLGIAFDAKHLLSTDIIFPWVLLHNTGSFNKHRFICTTNFPDKTWQIFSFCLKHYLFKSNCLSWLFCRMKTKIRLFGHHVEEDYFFLKRKHAWKIVLVPIFCKNAFYGIQRKLSFLIMLLKSVYNTITVNLILQFYDSRYLCGHAVRYFFVVHFKLYNTLNRN